MNNVIELIERFDPGHFERRYNKLLSLSKKLEDMGFYPLQITQNDIECYWVRLITDQGESLSITVETFYDLEDSPDLLNTLKIVAKYKKTTEWPMSYNKHFELNIDDIALIEAALRALPASKEIHELLGKIHNQKTWYRPKGAYVGG